MILEAAVENGTKDENVYSVSRAKARLLLACALR